MATDSWVGGGGISNFGKEGTSDSNWSTGSVPGSTDDAVVDTGSSGLLLGASSDQAVRSISLGKNDRLLLNSGSEFIAFDGTGPNVNNGSINLNDADLVIGKTSTTSTFDNSSTGSIVLNGTSTSAAAGIAIDGSVNLTGSGTIQMTIGDPVADNVFAGGGVFTDNTLTNETEDISGGGTIGGDLNFINDATVETNNSTSSSGGTLVIQGSFGGGFTNASTGVVLADNGGTLVFGVDKQTSGIVNNGVIDLDGSRTATTRLEIAGNVTISSAGTASTTTNVIAISDYPTTSISSDGNTATLSLTNQFLKGAGTVGDAHLKLNVQSGSTVDADVSFDDLVLDTGHNTINNAGLMEATNAAQLDIDSPVDNTGTILATNALVQVLAGISGSGTVTVGGGGALYTDAAIAGNVNFTSFGELGLGSSGEIGGLITGAAAGDLIDLLGVAFKSGEHAVWDQASLSGGTLSIYLNGSDLETLNLAGSYNSLNFAVSSDGSDTLITVQNTPSYAENPGDNDEWILSDGNWVESASPGSHPSGYDVALTGDWTGSGTDGILWFDPTTGDADEWQLSNTQWSASVDLGTHPANTTDGASYQIVGTDGATDFFGNGIDGVLWTSPNSDGTIATDIWELNSSGQWMASVSPGSHPAGYSVAGTGDWTGSGTDGILWFNSSTGDADEWQLSGGTWAASVDLGTHPTNSTDGNSYQIAGVGDFFDNGRDGVLWTSVNSDSTVATDIWELNSSGQWMASVSPGSHPAGYQVVGVGDFIGTGTSDILWYNASTGDTDEWLINNGNWASSIDLGTHPGGYQIAGVGDFNGAGNDGVLWHASP